MRFIDLEVKSFQAIAAARVEFGPGLNVLYGPNDLGKSTLVTALRAALLVPAKSTDGDPFVPWFGDLVPRVTLTLEDDEGRFWRVTKEFGANGGLAELRTSKDGQQFSLEAKAREVDERLRGLLAWGIPGLGGKRGSRGVPDSFLVNALLAGQTDVESIFTSTLDDDPTDSGKVRLTRALAALAQDPLFKQVLDAAQAEVDAFFTSTGRKRSGARARFTIVGDRVKALQDELAQLTAELQQSASTESTVKALRLTAEAAHAREVEALGVVEAARRGVEQSRSRLAAEEKVQQTRASLSRIDEVLARGQALAAELTRLEAAAKTDEAEKARVEAMAVTAAEAVRAAEDALQRAQSEEGARARELKRATLASRLAALSATAARLGAQREKAMAAADRRRALATAEAEHERLSKELAGLGGQLETAKQNAELARLILDYGRWREAERGSAQAAKAREELAALQLKAQALAGEALLKEQAVGKATQALELRREKLPTAAALAQLVALEGDLKLAEARIGGGLTVAVRPRDELRLHVELDDEAPTDEVARAEKERVFDAERKLALTIGQMVEIEVTTGSKEDRRTRDALAKRWRAESSEAFSRAEVSSVAALRALHAELEREAEALERERAAIARLKAESTSAAQRAELVERGLSSATSAEELKRRRDRIPEAQLEVLQRIFETLSPDWEADAEGQQSAAKKTLEALAERTTRLRAALAAADERRKAAQPAKDELSQEAFAALELELSTCAAEQKSVAAGLEALEAEQGAEVKTAQRALEERRQEAQLAARAQVVASQQLEVTRAALNEQRGQAAALKAEAERLDRPAAARALQAAEATLAPLLVTPVVTPAQLEEAERLLAASHAQTVDADAEYHKAEGALSKVGGPQVRERVRALEEALAIARAREAEVELDAESWRLLKDTLREAENSESGHLGRALSAPVAEQFKELTAGRYGAVELGPGLSTASVTATGANIDGATVLGALSVGTRDQLASLLRVAIARQLKSALVLDDHLVHTDAARMGWFVEVLRKTALEAQVLVFTCRPLDYATPAQLEGPARRVLAGGSLCLVDLARTIEGWPQRSR